MSERWSSSVIGWIFVVVGGVALAAQVARTTLGQSESWVEWPVMVAFASLFLLIGVANLQREPRRWLVALMLVGCLGVYVGVGGALLLTADSGWTVARGVVLILGGTALVAPGWHFVRRRRTQVRDQSQQRQKGWPAGSR